MTVNQPLTVPCNHGIDCVADAPGHYMTFMRRRLARASRKGWADCWVTGFERDWVLLEDMFYGTRYTAWHHQDLRAELTVGAMVSLSTMFNTLAVSDQLLSVIYTCEGK